MRRAAWLVAAAAGSLAGAGCRGAWEVNGGGSYLGECGAVSISADGEGALLLGAVYLAVAIPYLVYEAWLAYHD